MYQVKRVTVLSPGVIPYVISIVTDFWNFFHELSTTLLIYTNIKHLNFLSIRVLTCDKLTGHNLVILNSSITYTWDYY